jgi:hypothetical protein
MRRRTTTAFVIRRSPELTIGSATKQRPDPWAPDGYTGANPIAYPQREEAPGPGG